MKKTGWQGDRCDDKNFHGTAKSLEVGCALRLFEKSVEKEDYPFRYKTLVGDGDSNVIKHILEENFYGEDCKVEKEECLFHLRKSVRKRLYGVFDSLSIFERKREKEKIAYEKLGPDDFNKRRVFTKETCLTYQNRFANLYLFVLNKAVKKQNHSQSPESLKYMSDSIKAIPRHYMDHIGASLEERKQYHALCHKDFCKFKKLSPKDQEKYEVTKNGEFYIDEYNQKGEKIDDCMKSIINVFDELGSVDVMSRCTRLLNQNVNESIHARCFRIVNKINPYEYDHYNFAAFHALLIHNNSHELIRGMWYEEFGEYSEADRKNFVAKDNLRRFHAGPKHQEYLKKQKYLDKKGEIHQNQDINYNPGQMFEDMTTESLNMNDTLMTEAPQYRTYPGNPADEEGEKQ